MKKILFIVLAGLIVSVVFGIDVNNLRHGVYFTLINAQHRVQKLDEPIDIGNIPFLSSQNSMVRIKDVKQSLNLVVFWATWCPYCQTEFKEIDSFNANGKPSYIGILPINAAKDDSIAKIKNFYEENNITTLPIFVDASYNLARAVGMTGFPSYYLVKNNQAIAKLRPDWDQKESLRELLEQYFVISMTTPSSETSQPTAQ